jgi:hypothetical protein
MHTKFLIGNPEEKKLLMCILDDNIKMGLKKEIGWEILDRTNLPQNRN